MRGPGGVGDNAMLPLLRGSTSPRIVNVSSAVASLTRQADPDIEIGPVMAAYSPSKRTCAQRLVPAAAAPVTSQYR